MQQPHDGKNDAGEEASEGDRHGHLLDEPAMYEYEAAMIEFFYLLDEVHLIKKIRERVAL